MEDGRRAAENILEEHISYNTENGILPSETTVCRRLLSRYAELIEAYDELWAKANQSEFQLRVFIDGLLGTAAFWNPAKMAEARRMRAKLEDVNQKISGMAMELAELFENALSSMTIPALSARRTITCWRCSVRPRGTIPTSHPLCKNHSKPCIASST